MKAHVEDNLHHMLAAMKGECNCKDSPKMLMSCHYKLEIIQDLLVSKLVPLVKLPMVRITHQAQFIVNCELNNRLQRNCSLECWYNSSEKAI